MRSQQQPVIPITVLETKLYVPRPRRGTGPAVAAERAPGPGTGSKLVLVSAPAGFGKTTLLTEWLATAPPDGARRVRRPGCRWTRATTTRRTSGPTSSPGCGRSRRRWAPALSTSSSRPRHCRWRRCSRRSSTTSAAIDGDVVLVLDDYHVIESRDVHEAMTFLLDHLPPQLHLVIASRADPPLPLARLRARGELVEVRAAELRFTADGDRGVPQRVDGPRAHRARRRRPRGTHGGLDRRAPARRAVDAGTRRRHGVHRRLRR